MKMKFLRRKQMTLGEMRAEMKGYGVEFSDPAFSALTLREVRKTLRKARKMWKHLRAMESFIHTKERQVGTTT